MTDSYRLVTEVPAEAGDAVSPEALAFVALLHRTFNPRREELLQRRQARHAAILNGAVPGFLAETVDVRAGDWQVAPAPADLNDRRVEITGPTDRKMLINALNSGARVFMADHEDALSPTWENVTVGQKNLADAVRKTIRFEQEDGRVYELNANSATLLLRPRGWHLIESHVEIDGEPCSASLFDFGLYFFNNAQAALDRGSGPYFYLPKMESHLEARLWNDVFTFAEEQLGIPYGTVRATVLIETILAAFEMEEILYELRDHAAGLNAGRWDYIFSMIKFLRESDAHILPDRAQVTMKVPFMAAYSNLLVKTCHKRGAHAIGGMSAFIPTRRDAEVNERAFAAVREDKERESNAGFDGTWVAHPGLVPVAMECFDAVLGDQPNQKSRQRDDVVPDAGALLATAIDGGQVTGDGLYLNVSVALQYIDNWLRGNGAAAINNLMEDAATAEISRAQVWQWIRHGVSTSDGQIVDRDRYQVVRDAAIADLGGIDANRYRDAAEILDGLILNDDFVEFLTIPAYSYLD
ncbi:MAG: malate synthase A [Thermomicrobiales bacterium]|jgi:malate synthase|nr:malate synthase A [Thermomicrobiales bacterium]